MSEHKAKFLDCTGAAAPKLKLWPAVVISREEIEAEVERLTHLSPSEARSSRPALDSSMTIRYVHIRWRV